jgi:hypothetical protein
MLFMTFSIRINQILHYNTIRLPKQYPEVGRFGFPRWAACDRSASGVLNRTSDIRLLACNTARLTARPDIRSYIRTSWTCGFPALRTAAQAGSGGPQARAGGGIGANAAEEGAGEGDGCGRGGDARGAAAGAACGGAGGGEASVGARIGGGETRSIQQRDRSGRAIAAGAAASSAAISASRNKYSSCER